MRRNCVAILYCCSIYLFHFVLSHLIYPIRGNRVENVAPSLKSRSQKARNLVKQIAASGDEGEASLAAFKVKSGE